MPANEDKKYGAEEIQILEGLDGVRRRPGMYIGDTGVKGLHHLIWEILDNAIDEALAGYCDKIEITLNPTGSVTISDNGRGIPTDIHPVKGIPAVDVVFTMLHAGGKFDSGSYSFSGGLHGVGASVVNALSCWVKVSIAHGDGIVWEREYCKGDPYKELNQRKTSSSSKGSSIEFLPDSDIFETIEFDINKILRRVKEISYLLPTLKVIVTDAREQDKDNVRYVIQNPKGLAGLIRDIASGEAKDVVSVSIDRSEDESGFITSQRNMFTTHYEEPEFRADIAFAYLRSYSDTILSFVNLIPTSEGGTHVSGFRQALTKAINNVARKTGALKEKMSNITGAELQEGLLAVVSVYVKEPQFEGQTKGKLGNSEIEPKVLAVVYDALTKYFEKYPKEVKSIVDKALLARKAKEKARAAVELVRHGSKTGLQERLELPAKLASCTSKDSSKCELFLVEGDSAGGSAKQARNREFQAIMPLRGKILNCHKADLKKIVTNAEIKTIIQILGCGTKQNYDESKLKYDKIIILTDADVDGSHISCLLITFFYNIIPQLLENGHIYVAQPPLFMFKQEKAEPEYLFTEQELNARMEEYRAECKKKKKTIPYRIQRYKGLGEMNPEQLWATTMDPVKRSLIQIKIENWEELTETVDLLMGENVEPRKKWIMASGASNNLDI